MPDRAAYVWRLREFARAFVRLRLAARRFISALRSSGLSFAQKEPTALDASSFRSFLVVPFHRRRPASSVVITIA
jgi:hypothetical protein